MPDELLLLHLALDFIGQTWEWDGELCKHGHSLPRLAQPAWMIYDRMLGSMILARAIVRAETEAEE